MVRPQGQGEAGSMRLKLRYTQYPGFRFGIILLILLVVTAGLWLIVHPLSAAPDMGHRLESPSSRYLLGTDEYGRDLVSCISIGTGISLFIAVMVMTVSSAVGSILGIVSGYKGGGIDFFIQRMVDILLAFPGILLALAAAAFFHGGIITLILILTFTGWVGFARIVRAEVLRIKKQDYILAARSYNAPVKRVIFYHIIPVVMPLIKVRVWTGIPSVILAESTLNFLGIGLDPRTPTLGQLIDAGRGHMFDHPQLMAAPAIVLFLVVIAFVFIASGFKKKLSIRSVDKT